MVCLKQIGQGRTADIFELSEDRILKLYKEGFPEEATADEFQISSIVYDQGINCPRPIEKISDNNRHGIIFERVLGTSLLHSIRRNPFLIKKCSRILAMLHYELHSRTAIDIPREQKMVLIDNIQAALILTESEKLAIIDYLKQLPDDDKLCHGDFHPDNILFDREFRVIDWMTGAAGNPSGDVARSLIILIYGTMHEKTPKLIQVVVNFLRHHIKSEYIKHYLKISGKSFNEIDSWILPVAAARLVESIPETEKEKLVKVIRTRLQSIDGK